MIDKMNTQSGVLQNVVIVRPILIILLVFYHAFAPFSGVWEPVTVCSNISLYWWLDKLSFAFLLEFYVFVSGYVFGYQVRMRGESKLNAKVLLGSKFKRLIVPCVIFSFIYILLFRDFPHPSWRIFYDVFNGVGHMWFLPMLFWCFIGVWGIEKIHVKAQIALSVLLIISILPMPSLPLRLDSTLYYLCFFYAGYILQRNSINIERFYKPIVVVSLFIIFAITFPLVTLLSQMVDITMHEEIMFMWKVIIKILIRFGKLFYSSVGLMTLFIGVGTFLKSNSFSISPLFTTIGNNSMGVYLFQQFVLIALYYHTIFPASCNLYLLPWIGFFVAMVVSLLLTSLFRLTRFGRFLVG